MSHRQPRLTEIDFLTLSVPPRISTPTSSDRSVRGPRISDFMEVCSRSFETHSYLPWPAVLSAY